MAFNPHEGKKEVHFTNVVRTHFCCIVFDCLNLKYLTSGLWSVYPSCHKGKICHDHWSKWLKTACQWVFAPNTWQHSTTIHIVSPSNFWILCVLCDYSVKLANGSQFSAQNSYKSSWDSYRSDLLATLQQIFGVKRLSAKKILLSSSNILINSQEASAATFVTFAAFAAKLHRDWCIGRSIKALQICSTVFVYSK